MPFYKEQGNLYNRTELTYLYISCSPLACGLPLYVCHYRNSNCKGKGEVPNKHHAMTACEGVEVYVHVF
jgi:hypothetical protein